MAPSGSEWCQVEFERLNYTERMLFSDQCCCLVDKNGVFLCRNVAQ